MFFLSFFQCFSGSCFRLLWKINFFLCFLIPFLSSFLFFCAFWVLTLLSLVSFLSLLFSFCSSFSFCFQPQEYAVKHDRYLKNYIQTGKKKIIGTGRALPLLTRAGSVVSGHLSVVESKVGGRRVFVGTLTTKQFQEELQEVRNARFCFLFLFLFLFLSCLF